MDSSLSRSPSTSRDKMENSKSRSSSKESIKKRKMSMSSKGSDAESESDYGENGLGSAYFNVFPDPTVEGNCITVCYRPKGPEKNII